MRAALGHDGPPTGMWQNNLVTGEPLKRCPLREIQLAPGWMRAEMYEYLNVLHPLYEKGFLLQEGAVQDQPSRYIDYVRAIDVMQARWSRRHLELSNPTEDDAG